MWIMERTPKSYSNVTLSYELTLIIIIYKQYCFLCIIRIEEILISRNVKFVIFIGFLTTNKNSCFTEFFV